MIEEIPKSLCRVYHSQRFQDHRTGAHPECPARLKSIDKACEHLLQSGTPLDMVTASGLHSRLDELLASVHQPAYLSGLTQFAAHGGGRWDADTVVCPDSPDVARLAVSTVMTAVDDLLTGQCPTGFCAIRPPGHHCLADRAMGFCLFNNVVAAARWAIQAHQLNRVLIIDWDVHHGNGTQDLTEADEQIWFLSLHRHPFYPGTGLAGETGRGAGQGTVKNVPLPAGTGSVKYLQAFESAAAQIADRCRPELILISAGFDAHHLDPIGSLGLESDDFATLTSFVGQLARTHCQGRILSLLEGGYHLEALGESVSRHLTALSQLHPAGN